MASKYGVMTSLAPLLAEFLFKIGILFGEYFHFGTYEKYVCEIDKCERQHLSTLLG